MAKNQICFRISPCLYLAIQGYMNKHQLTQTQLVTYAIASYIENSEEKEAPMNNYSPVALEVDDLKIDVRDIESFLENLDRRLLKIEKKYQTKTQVRVPYQLTDSQKYSIIQYVKKCQKSDLPIIIKEILYYLGLNPDHQGQQQQVASVLKSQNLMKVRRKIDGNKFTNIWVK